MTYQHWTEEDYLIHQAKGIRVPNLHQLESDTADPGPESRLLSKCTKWLRDNYYKYIHVQGKKNKAGILDLYCFLPKAHVVVLELKTKTGRMSDEQKQWVSYLTYHGYKVYPGVKSFKRFLEIMNMELK